MIAVARCFAQPNFKVGLSIFCEKGGPIPSLLPPVILVALEACEQGGRCYNGVFGEGLNCSMAKDVHAE